MEEKFSCQGIDESQTDLTRVMSFPKSKDRSRLSPTAARPKREIAVFGFPPGGRRAFVDDLISCDAPRNCASQRAKPRMKGICEQGSAHSCKNSRHRSNLGRDKQKRTYGDSEASQTGC
jgi:hypothetical protein